jgi:NAD(P)-dependent dehydrogenase (short-subunit alcohol dehydrogenase family)
LPSPIRVNLIAAGFVDTPLSARSSATSSTRAVTGATFDIDGGQQLVE